MRVIEKGAEQRSPRDPDIFDRRKPRRSRKESSSRPQPARRQVECSFPVCW